MPISRINTNSIANNTIQGADLLDASITAAKIISVANTQITGNIISSQITSVANTQISGNIIGSQISSNTLSNTVFQTGSVENYLNANSLNFGVRNILINGAMQVAQRGTTSTSTGYQTVDRWKVPNMTNQAQLTDAPTGFSNSLEVTGTVGGSSGYGIIDQFIEAKNIAYAVGKTVTLSAYVKNTGTSTVNVSCEIYSANSADTFSSTTLVSSLTSQSITTGWTRIVFPSFSVPAGAANGLQVRIFRYDGSNSQKWQITGVQLEVGTSPTPFEYRSYGQEFALCQRYYQMLANYNQNNGVSPITNISFVSSTDFRAICTFPVVMRSNPTLVSGSGSSYFRIYNGSNYYPSSLVLDFSSPQGMGLISGGGITGATPGTGGIIFTNAAGGYLAATAEL